MATPEPTIQVVAGLIQQAGQLLICQRRQGTAFAYKWEFPGGKIEPGESAPQALRRELHEELGIVAEIGPEMYRTRHAYPGRYTVELLFYAITVFAGSVENLTFEQVCWVAPAHLPTFDFLEGDAELITLLSQGQLTLPQSQA